jgi:hypothetical protein
LKANLLPVESLIDGIFAIRFGHLRVPWLTESFKGSNPYLFPVLFALPLPRSERERASKKNIVHSLSRRQERK